MSNVDATNAQVFFRTRQQLEFFVEEFGAEFLERVEDRTPVKTGHLQNSWALAETSDNMFINNDASYAVYVEAWAHMLKLTFSERENISKVAARRAKGRAGVK